MDARSKAILSHITVFGWIIALLINEREKEEFASFYIRQTLGIFLSGMIISIIPIINVIVGLVLFAFWLISLINCIDRKYYLIPWVGNLFQDFFRKL